MIFLVERTMACRTEEDVRRLFGVEASDYWKTHFIPGSESDARPKRIGAFKANIIGINLVAILQFAYGSYTSSERLRDSASLSSNGSRPRTTATCANGPPPAYGPATPSKARPSCNSQRSIVRHTAAPNAPSGVGSFWKSPKCTEKTPFRHKNRPLRKSEAD